MSKEILLELRRKMKLKRPHFVRQEGHSAKKLANDKKWRQPKGQHSKLRRKFRGKVYHPSPGYSSPKAVRGLHSSGLKVVLVKNINDLNGLKANEHGLTLSNIGTKKKLQIVKKAIELKLKIFNLRNPEGFVKEIEDRINKKKEERKSKEEKKKKSKEDSLKKAEEKKKEGEKKEENTSKEETTQKDKEEQEKREVLGGKK